MRIFKCTTRVEAEEIVEMKSMGRVHKLILKCGKIVTIPSKDIKVNNICVGGFYMLLEDGSWDYESAEYFKKNYRAIKKENSKPVEEPTIKDELGILTMDKKALGRLIKKNNLGVDINHGELLVRADVFDAMYKK